MSEEDRRTIRDLEDIDRYGTGFYDEKISYKKFNDILLRLERLERQTQRTNNPNATQKVVENPTSVVEGVDHDVTRNRGNADAHTQFPLVSGTRAQEKVKLNTATDTTLSEGEIGWNDDDKAVQYKTDIETIIQIGHEQVIRFYNDSGVQIDNGSVVYIDGADVASDKPTVALGNANSIVTSETIIGMVTTDVPNATQGFVTTFGLVRDLDTSSCVAGDEIYLDTTDGGFTATKPAFPNWIVSLGFVLKVHATDGIVFFSPVVRDTDHAWNGTFNENFDFLVTTDDPGGTPTKIIGTLERSGGGDLTMRFNDGWSVLDCTPIISVDLTAGTLSSPQLNFVYVPKSTKLMTVSTTQFPTTEHIKVAIVYVQTITKVDTDGALINQNINNYQANVSSQRGRIELMSEKIRQLGINYISGIDPNGATVDDNADATYFTIAGGGAGTVYWLSTSGVIKQMHDQSIAAYNTSTGDKAHVVNDAVTPFDEITNLADITTLADGVTSLSNNKYFNLVFWKAGNKNGEYAPLMINLPTDQYTSKTAAVRDDNKTAVFTIPEEFRIDSSTGFLVVRATFQYKTSGDWVIIDQEDLRDQQTRGAGGASTALAQTEFSDNVHAIFNNADNTKIIKHDASGISTGNTRTLTVQDKSYTIADDADVFYKDGSKAATGNFDMGSNNIDNVNDLEFENDLYSTDNSSRMALGNAIVSTLGFNFRPHFTANNSVAMYIRPSFTLTGTNAAAYGRAIDVISMTLSAVSDIVTAFYHDRIFENAITGSGSITTQYGLYIDEMNNAGTNYDLFLAGDNAEKKTTATFAVTSTIAVKNVLRNSTLGLEAIMSLVPKVWKHNNEYGFRDDGKEHTSIIAEDLLNTPFAHIVEERPHQYNFRDVDTGKKDREGNPIFETINDTTNLKKVNGIDEIIWALVNAVKELKLKNDELETRLQSIGI